MSAREVVQNQAPVRRLKNQLMLAAGDKAIYPGLGPCRIGRIENKVVGDASVMFYHLIILDDSRGELFVPVEKARNIGVRSMLKKSQIPKLLAHLQKNAKAADNWKQRATDNSKLLSSGSPYDLAEIVASLTGLRNGRPLTLGESGTLDRARRLLVCEISEVMGTSKTDVEEQITKLLNESSYLKKSA